jgi:hypothetical protein
MGYCKQPYVFILVSSHFIPRGNSLVTFLSHASRNGLKVRRILNRKHGKKMKTKYLLLGIGALLLAGIAWGGRVAWRIQHQLVTLDVRNMPLPEVLRKVERQTWKKIRAEQNLDTRITLHVRNKPLSYVLDRIGEQAGARWSTVYAVYNSAIAVKALDKSLRADSKIESAGWTRVAPKPPPTDEMPEAAGQLIKGKGMASEAPPAGARRMMVVQSGSGGPVVMVGGPDGKMESWSPEELVTETPLSTRLDDQQLAPTAKCAAESAKKVNGKWTTFIALRKSPMGIGFKLPPIDRQGGGGAGGRLAARGPPGSGGPSEPHRPNFDPMKHNPNERFARLTPEQRVQQARERAQGGGRIVEQRIEKN